MRYGESIEEWICINKLSWKNYAVLLTIAHHSMQAFPYRFSEIGSVYNKNTKVADNYYVYVSKHWCEYCGMEIILGYHTSTHWAQRKENVHSVAWSFDVMVDLQTKPKNLHAHDMMY